MIRILCITILIVFSALLWSDGPTPAAMAADWLADAPAATVATDAQASATAATAPDVVPGGWLGWLVGLIGTALLYGRIAAKANPMASLILAICDGAWKLFAPRIAQDAEAKRDLSAETLVKIVDYIDEIDANGGTAKDLKGLIMRRLPSKYADRIDEALDLVRNQVLARPTKLIEVSNPETVVSE